MNRSKQFLSLLAASVCGGAVALFLAHVLLKEKNLPAPVPAPTSASEKTKQNPELSRPLPISGQDAGTLQAQFSETISRSMPAVVLITAQKRIGVVSPYANLYNYGRRRIDYMEIPSGQGSGFFIREDGYILTNHHVVRNQDSFWITTHEGEEYPAKVVGIDPPTDLALLKIDAKRKFPVLEFADAESVRIGHWAIAIGAPFSLSRTVTIGIVSNTRRNGVGMNLHESYVQTDASINPGNSGGPLLNIQGKVIGVNDFILSPSGGNIGLSFAISSDIARQVSTELINHGHVDRPWLGAVLAPLNRNAKKKLGIEHGVLISQLFRNSPAAKALRPGDIVLKANGRDISTPYDLQGCIFSLLPGAKLNLTIRRSGKTIPVELILTKSPRNWFRGGMNADDESVYVRQL